MKDQVVVKSIAQEIKQSMTFDNIHVEASLTVLRTAAKIRLFMDRCFQDKGVSAQQYNVLRILRGAGRPLPIMEVAERLVEPTAGITRLIKKLEQQAYVKRTPCELDQRVKYISITQLGRDFMLELNPAVIQAGETASRQLEDDEVETLLALLNKLRAHIPE
jgi:DNA-binding MarR family transcriptional regulator